MAGKGIFSWRFEKVMEGRFSNMEVEDCQDLDDTNEWSMISDSDTSTNVSKSQGDISFNDDTTDDDWEVLSEEERSNSFVEDCNQVLLPHDESLPITAKIEDGLEYVEHVVMPTDTIQGLCLAYKVSATKLRMVNRFSGNSLSLAPSKLRIPLNRASLKNGKIRLQDENSKDFKIHELLSKFPSLKHFEAKSYLDNNENNLEMAICTARDDLEWKQSMKRPAPHPQRFELFLEEGQCENRQNLNVIFSVRKDISSPEDNVGDRCTI